MWIGELSTHDSLKNFRHWQGRIESIEYYFKRDIKFLCNHSKNIQNMFLTFDPYPDIILLMLEEEINIETVTIIHILSGLMNKERPNDPLWEKIRMRVIKYSYLIEINKHKYENILSETIKEETMALLA